jgi:hypothetical protein
MSPVASPVKPPPLVTAEVLRRSAFSALFTPVTNVTNRNARKMGKREKKK